MPVAGPGGVTSTRVSATDGYLQISRCIRLLPSTWWSERVRPSEQVQARVGSRLFVSPCFIMRGCLRGVYEGEGLFITRGEKCTAVTKLSHHLPYV
jgi:hypothetical protein